MEITPVDRSIACPEAFAAALVSIREGYGCKSWLEFSEKLYDETGRDGRTPIRIGRGLLETHASSVPTRARPPGLGLLHCLELAGMLYFENGDPVTREALAEIYYCQRLPSGDLVEAESTNA